MSVEEKEREKVRGLRSDREGVERTERERCSVFRNGYRERATNQKKWVERERERERESAYVKVS